MKWGVSSIRLAVFINISHLHLLHILIFDDLFTMCERQTIAFSVIYIRFYISQ